MVDPPDRPPVESERLIYPHARWVWLAATVCLICADCRAPPLADVRAAKAHAVVFQSFADRLPVCRPDVAATSVEAALARRWVSGECVVVQGRLVLVPAAPPCSGPVWENPDGSCELDWVLWSATAAPPPAAVDDAIASGAPGGRVIALVNRPLPEGSGPEGCDGPAPEQRLPPLVKGRGLPDANGQDDVVAARGALPDLRVVLMGVVSPDPDETPQDQFGWDLATGIHPQPKDITTWPLQVTRLCRLR